MGAPGLAYGCVGRFPHSQTRRMSLVTRHFFCPFRFQFLATRVPAGAIFPTSSHVTLHTSLLCSERGKILRRGGCWHWAGLPRAFAGAIGTSEYMRRAYQAHSTAVHARAGDCADTEEYVAETEGWPTGCPVLRTDIFRLRRASTIPEFLRPSRQVPRCLPIDRADLPGTPLERRKIGRIFAVTPS
jgi:hypothetical protein